MAWSYTITGLDTGLSTIHQQSITWISIDLLTFLLQDTVNLGVVQYSISVLSAFSIKTSIVVSGSTYLATVKNGRYSLIIIDHDQNTGVLSKL